MPEPTKGGERWTHPLAISVSRIVFAFSDEERRENVRIIADRVQELAARAERGERDTARLDWMEKAERGVWVEGTNIREAIDLARTPPLAGTPQPDPDFSAARGEGGA